MMGNVDVIVVCRSIHLVRQSCDSSLSWNLSLQGSCCMGSIPLPFLCLEADISDRKTPIQLCTFYIPVLALYPSILTSSPFDEGLRPSCLASIGMEEHRVPPNLLRMPMRVFFLKYIWNGVFGMLASVSSYLTYTKKPATLPHMFCGTTN